MTHISTTKWNNYRYVSYLIEISWPILILYDLSTEKRLINRHFPHRILWPSWLISQCVGLLVYKSTANDMGSQLRVSVVQCCLTAASISVYRARKLYSGPCGAASFEFLLVSVFCQVFAPSEDAVPGSFPSCPHHDPALVVTRQPCFCLACFVANIQPCPKCRTTSHILHILLSGYIWDPYPNTYNICDWGGAV